MNYLILKEVLVVSEALAQNNNKIIISMKNKYKEKVADIIIDISKRHGGLLFISGKKFFTRLWFLLTNPFRYLFTGHIKF